MGKRVFILMVILLGVGRLAYAQTESIVGYWFNEEKNAKIQIYKARNGKFYGKVAWLKVPDMNGVPKTDMNNPDAAQRTRPIIGLMILKGLVQEGTNAYDDGEIYDPKNGKYYTCKATIKGNVMELRGYMGFSLIGRTTVWTRAD